jgi:hypothetical protein
VRLERQLDDAKSVPEEDCGSVLTDVAKRAKKIIPSQHRSSVVLPVVRDREIYVRHDDPQTLDVWIVAAPGCGAAKCAKKRHAFRHPAICACRFVANWLMICAAVALDQADATAILGHRAGQHKVGVHQHLASGTRRNEAVALAPPRSLVLIPFAFTRALWLTGSSSSPPQPRAIYWPTAGRTPL